MTILLSFIQSSLSQLSKKKEKSKLIPPTTTMMDTEVHHRAPTPALTMKKFKKRTVPFHKQTKKQNEY
jgi:hypothetical protein